MYCTQYLSHLLTVINSSVNFYIYCYKQYRSRLGQMFHRTRQNTTSMTTQVGNSNYDLIPGSIIINLRQLCCVWSHWTRRRQGRFHKCHKFEKEDNIQYTAFDGFIISCSVVAVKIYFEKKIIHQMSCYHPHPSLSHYHHHCHACHD